MISERDPNFYSELKQLNEDLVNYLKLTIEKSPFFNLTPTLKDYIQQYEDINRQYLNQAPAPSDQPAPIKVPPSSPPSSPPSPSSAPPSPASVPPEPDSVQYEETGYKYSARCKLYEGTKTKPGGLQFHVLGVGMIYVKALDVPTKTQVIFRQEPDLKRVLLNEIVSPSVPLKTIQKAVQFAFPGPNGNAFYVAKFKDDQERDRFYELLWPSIESASTT